MTTTVTPDTFRFVEFDADTIRKVAEDLLGALGLSGRDLAIEVDETTPLGRTSIEADDSTITIRAESGAFEDTRRPRQQSDTAVATAVGRALLRIRDRQDGSFDDAPADTELTLAELAAWEAYSMGRLARLGVAVNQQRWRYNFRNRHGFSDVSDEVFDRLWSSTSLSWDELAGLSRVAASGGRALATG